MVKRSLQASASGIQQAKRAFAYKGWTQENLAGEVGLKTRQSVWRFFTGQPVERQVFQELCSILDLDWRHVAIDPPAEFPESRKLAQVPDSDIDTLVRQVKWQRRSKIEDQCGTLQMLNMSRPVKVDDLYIHVDILEDIPSQQWLELADLDRFALQVGDRPGLEPVAQTRIAGGQAVEIYSKLRVLGRPGTGKTTFLQHLALQCNRDNFAVNRVPIFVGLRDFADESRASTGLSLLTYMFEDFRASGITSLAVLETLLQEGRILLLLDGLDEVLNQDCKMVVNEIRRLAEKYQQNSFVVTCRTAATALNLKRFTDLEMASFTSAQIAAFAQKWFIARTKTTFQAGQEQAIQFIQQLYLPEHLTFCRLAMTPLLLDLICWLFQRQGRFPTQRAEVYKQCLQLLFSKWDETKGLERDGMGANFSMPQKLKLLSKIATATFEQGAYLFDRQAAEQYIEDYIRDLPNAPIEPEELQSASEAILKAIEVQHGLIIERGQGVFAFCDPVFQEYFTARTIVANYNSQSSNQVLKQLVSHLREPWWREIFLLTVTMLRNADSLVQLMQQEIAAIVAQEPYLQKFLTWASHQSLAASPQAAVTRATHSFITQPEWHFSVEQQEILHEYYAANQLLLDCLHSDCKVTPVVLQEIEASLLLPQQQLEQQAWSNSAKPLG